VPGSDFLQLDRSIAPARGVATWLTGALRSAVADGRLPVGSAVPPTRVLAVELGVSRGAVVEAYRRLSDEGLLEGRRGGGTTVTTAVAHAEPARTTSSQQPAAFDLTPGVPDLSAFPAAAWLRAERAVLSELTPAALRYGDPRGAAPLRAAVAGWLARRRGVRVDPQDVLVVSGVAQALALLAHVLTARGTSWIGFEDPGSRGAREHIEHWGLRTVPVPVDDDGLVVDALRGSGVDAVVTTPAHQFPTGVVLAPQRRRSLVEWALSGGLVVEDDYDAEHRYDRTPVAAVQTLAPDRVVHVSSVSKSLAPALRLGWVVAPADLRSELVDAKAHTDICSPGLAQLVLARMMAGGELDRHLRLMHARHRRRRDAVLEAVATHLPQARVHGVAAGLHLMLTLPGVQDDVGLAARALELEVRTQALSMHRRSPGVAGLVLGYAACPPDRLREAVQRIASVVG